MSMEEKILELLSKGMALIEAVRRAQETASPAIKAVYDLIEKHRSHIPVTDAELAEVERILDEQLEQFNEPLPDV